MSLSGIFPIDRWNFTTRSILNILPEEDQQFLLSNQSDQQYGRGEVIFREGAVPQGIFMVQSGTVKKYKSDKLGKEQIIYVAGKGELIGYHALLAEERYPDSAAAMEHSLVSFIPKEDFNDVVHRSHPFALRLLKALSHEFTVLANSISVFAQRTAAERLAIVLVVLREKFKDDDAKMQALELNISRTDLANMAGIAKENVIRLLRDFKEEGIIETDGRRIRILDIQSLVKKTNYR